MSLLDTAWTGKKASYVADLGRYGKVGYSELAMHTRIAGKEVVRFALWPADDGVHVGWAHVQTEDGRITDGLPSEVLPGSVRSKLGYGDEMMPRESRKKNPWYHGLSRDGVREVFWNSSRDPVVANKRNRYASVTGPYNDQLAAMMEAAEIADVEPVQPMQVMSQQGVGALRIKRPAGWPLDEVAYPPTCRQCRRVGDACICGRQSGLYGNPPRRQNKMRWPITLLVVDQTFKPVMGATYGPSTLADGIAEMKHLATLLAIKNGTEYALVRLTDLDIRDMPQGIRLHPQVVAERTIFVVDRDERKRNPWFSGVSVEGVPEVYWRKTVQEGAHDPRYSTLHGISSHRTQKEAELATGRWYGPHYQVLGKKPRIIKAPARPGRHIVETTRGVERRERWGLCNADAAWPYTGSIEEIMGRRHNPCHSSRRRRNPLDVPDEIKDDPQFQKELAAYRKRHGMEPVEVRRVKVPDGYPKYMSAWGKAPKVFYDASNRSSNKGKRVHQFGEGGHDKPWLVSSEERGPKFLAYVGGDFDAAGEWIEK